MWYYFLCKEQWSIDNGHLCLKLLDQRCDNHNKLIDKTVIDNNFHIEKMILDPAALYKTEKANKKILIFFYYFFLPFHHT